MTSNNDDDADNGFNQCLTKHNGILDDSSDDDDNDISSSNHPNDYVVVIIMMNSDSSSSTTMPFSPRVLAYMGCLKSSHLLRPKLLYFAWHSSPKEPADTLPASPDDRMLVEPSSVSTLPPHSTQVKLKHK